MIKNFNMNIIVGYSGLVGSTLIKNNNFDLLLNSSNLQDIDKINGGYHDITLTCLPSKKWLVNKDPIKDFQNMYSIIDRLKKIKFENVTLISTIDVYQDSPIFSDEEYIPNFSKLSYGSNRYLFEVFVRDIFNFSNLKIFRLPALFSMDINKNILYDLLNNNNVYDINKNSNYQWYNLDNLDRDIKYFSSTYKDETIFNLFTEPIDTNDILSLFPEYGIDKYKSLHNINYNYKTKFSESGYISDRNKVIKEIKKFIDEYRSNKFIN